MSSRIAACGQPPVSTARMCARGQRVVADQELGVLAREDVVRHDAEPQVVAQPPAQREQQRGLAAADRAADADGERRVAEVARAARAARSAKRPGPVPWLVRVTVIVAVRVVVRHRGLPSVTMEQPRVQPLVAACQQIEQRRGLRLGRSSRCAQCASTGRASARPAPAVAWPSRGPTSPSRTAAETSPRATPCRYRRSVASRSTSSAASDAAERPARGAAATLPRPRAGHAVRAPPKLRTHASPSARPWLRLARLATGLRSNASARDRARRAARARRAPRPRTAASRGPPARARRRRSARARPGRRARRACIAASSPPECANPPAGKRRVGELEDEPVAHLRTASTAAPAAASAPARLQQLAVGAHLVASRDRR